MAEYGYYRHPTISGDRVAFVSEDDLWTVSVEGGLASRLTANPGSQTRPRFSPDGSQIAFVSRDEGRLDVHVMQADGGSPRRVSHLGSSTETVGWTPDGDRIVVATDYRQPFAGWRHLWTVPVDGSAPEPLGIGPAFSASFAPDGNAMVIGRNQFDPARWKRYRGGRAGVLWIDRHGDGEFEMLVSLEGNMADPMWVGRRISRTTRELATSTR
jgi:tricorn protease